jgi:hypothetical protein
MRCYGALHLAAFVAAFTCKRCLLPNARPQRVQGIFYKYPLRSLLDLINDRLFSEALTKLSLLYYQHPFPSTFVVLSYI